MHDVYGTCAPHAYVLTRHYTLPGYEGIVVGGAGRGESPEVLREAIAAIRAELQDESVPVLVQGMDSLPLVSICVYDVCVCKCVCVCCVYMQCVCSVCVHDLLLLIC